LSGSWFDCIDGNDYIDGKMILEAVAMTSLTIRNLDVETKQKFRELAARHGKSMEEEARSMIRAAVNDNPAAEPHLKKGQSMWDVIVELREKYGTFELEIPERKASTREPPSFD
jgi:antitoxin FitA